MPLQVKSFFRPAYADVRGPTIAGDSPRSKFTSATSHFTTDLLFFRALAHPAVQLSPHPTSNFAELVESDTKRCCKRLSCLGGMQQLVALSEELAFTHKLQLAEGAQGRFVDRLLRHQRCPGLRTATFRLSVSAVSTKTGFAHGQVQSEAVKWKKRTLELAAS